MKSATVNGKCSLQPSGLPLGLEGYAMDDRLLGFGLLLLLAGYFVFWSLWLWRRGYFGKWEKLYERQTELLAQQLEVLRQINELLKKLTASR